MVSAGASKARAFRKWLAVFIVFASVALYAYFYQYDPFPEGVTDIVTGGMIVAAALAAAVVASMAWSRYGKGTPPRLIWLHYSVAMWGWAVGEVIWLYEYLTDGNYQLGPADIFWVASYFAFTVALYRQYALIYRPARAAGLGFLGLSVLAVLMFTYLYAIWLSGTYNQKILTLEILVNAFYAMGDAGLAAGALWLVFLFRDGALGRPWIGLALFAFSDLLYSWLETSGLYAWSVEEGNLLTTVTDTTYLAAYLVVAFGCFMQWLLLSYGPRLKYDA
ncbi:MAG: hypothetical protein AB1750_02010 [Chloroflexota bacterium]